jgi:hypothetical protein
MKDYEIVMVFDYAYIGLSVFADSKEEAIAQAYNQLLDSDITFPEPKEINVEIKGTFS